MSSVRGRPRDPVVTVFWAIVTLGLYAAWYWFIAFREVDHQNGRRHSALWFLGFIPVAGLVSGLLYVRHELRHLHADLFRLGAKPRTSFRAVVLWGTVGMLVLVGPLVALAKVVSEVNAYWAIVYGRHGIPWPGRAADAAG